MILEHFPIFIRALFPDAETSDEKLLALGEAFYNHLKDKFKDNPEQLEFMVDISPISAFLNKDNPLKTYGYNSALCLHLYEFIELIKEEAAQRGITPESIQEVIHVNIWDDYYDDGFVPKGKLQKSYICVEEREMNEDTQEQILSLVLERVLEIHKEHNIMSGVFIEDVGPQINLTNMTHAQRYRLLEELDKKEIFFEGKKLSIYSES